MKHKPRYVKCPYCGQAAKLIDSKDYYSSGKSYGLMYICRPCDATVGVHPGTNKPKGTLANKELRGLRMQCHKAFDGMKKARGMRRGTAYKYLSVLMDIDQKDCHVGMFRELECSLMLEKVEEDLKE